MPGARFVSGVAIPLKVMRHQAAGFCQARDRRARRVQPRRGPHRRPVRDDGVALAGEHPPLTRSVHRQATHDPLTQLHSHRAFQQRLQEEILRSGRSQTPLALIMLDVDHFKRYNDTSAIRPATNCCATCPRSSARLRARWTSPRATAARSSRSSCPITCVPRPFRSPSAFGRASPRSRSCFNGAPTRATMSLGVAAFPTDATTASQIVRVADERLYKAKHGGRNQVVG